MDFDFELLGPRREGGSDERTRSSSDVSSQFDLLSGSRFGIAPLVSDTLFSHHMADIFAIDHNRRDGHAGFLADFNCIQRFDECRNSTFGERLKGLDYKLSSAGVGTQVRFEIEPRRCRMTTPVWVMSHIRCAAEAGKTPRRLVITGTRSSPSSLCPRASVGDSGTPRRRE